MNNPMTPIRRILIQYKNRGITSAEEIASLVGCSVRRVHYVLEGEKNFWDFEVMTLCEHFSSMGHNELSKQFLSSRWGLVPVGDMKINGCLLDENGEITKIMGKLMSLHRGGNKEEALGLVDELIKQAKQVRAEIKNMD